ncbi:MAG: MarR family winged helix-turn-helix transcriptional regulator [Clostridium sp.]|uniref:MarR family winged helix-turn-helix transcriptional regulator n=1 Tax=Clostridium sp. TaxID=1506 RepID=UPI003EE64BAB
MNIENAVFLKTLGSVMKSHFRLSHEELEKEGLYPGQPQLLFVLYKQNGISQKEIADALQIKPSTITVMIKRLEKTEFIYKQADEKDGRISRIFLSSKGFKVCEKLKILTRKMDKICLENFTNKEIETLNNLLLKVKANLEAHEKFKNRSC